MNSNTLKFYSLARMYEFIEDIEELKKKKTVHDIVNDKFDRYSISMCIVQMGEFASRIRDADEEFYENNLELHPLKKLRDRIVHTYTTIDNNILENILINDIPKMRMQIQEMIPKEIIENPYLLYEMEYEDYLKNNEISPN